jgi:diketogulonate reductase-like aldo/keto reductase
MIARAFGATGVTVSVVGQGTWRMGESARRAKREIAALRLGIELGMTHIDTAEMYGDGGAERVVAQAIRSRRDRVFVATKVLPEHASYEGTIAACERSLKRLGTDHVDLYLLHWWTGRHPIAETMRAMRTLVRRGLVRFVGVSNLDVPQMAEARRALEDVPLACNQVLYHLRDRAIEADVLPWCVRRRVAVVGYTPLARGGFRKPAVERVARKHGRTPRQVVLNFLTRRPALFTIPKASRPEHVRENAGALDFALDQGDVAAIGAAR